MRRNTKMRTPDPTIVAMAAHEVACRRFSRAIDKCEEPNATRADQREYDAANVAERAAALALAKTLPTTKGSPPRTACVCQKALQRPGRYCAVGLVEGREIGLVSISGEIRRNEERRSPQWSAFQRRRGRCPQWQLHPALTLKKFSPDRDLARLGVLGLGQG